MTAVDEELLIANIRQSEELTAYEKRIVAELCQEEQPPLRRHLLASNLGYNSRNRIIEAVGRFGSVSANKAINLISDLYLDDLLTKNLICEALEILGQAEPQLALNVLQLLGADGYPVVRQSVAATVAALARSGHSLVISRLRSWSKAPQKELREIAASVFGLLPEQSSQSLELLMRLCRDSYAQVRLAALSSLRCFAADFSSEIIRLLKALSQDCRWGIRKQTALVLEKIEGQPVTEAISIIALLTLDLAPEVAVQAAKSLAVIAPAHPQATIEALRFLAKDHGILDVNVLRALIDAASSIAADCQDQVIPILELMIQDDDASVRNSAHDVLSAIRE